MPWCPGRRAGERGEILNPKEVALPKKNCPALFSHLHTPHQVKKRGKRGKKKKKKIPVEIDEEGGSQGGGEVRGGGGDEITMPMVGPDGTPKSEVKPRACAFKTSYFHLSLQKQDTEPNGEQIQTKEEETTDSDAEKVKICWYCHAPRETTKLFKCKGCHKVSTL